MRHGVPKWHRCWRWSKQGVPCPFALQEEEEDREEEPSEVPARKEAGEEAEAQARESIGVGVGDRAGRKVRPTELEEERIQERSGARPGIPEVLSPRGLPIHIEKQLEEVLAKPEVEADKILEPVGLRPWLGGVDWRTGLSVAAALALVRSFSTVRTPSSRFNGARGRAEIQLAQRYAELRSRPPRVSAGTGTGRVGVRGRGGMTFNSAEMIQDMLGAGSSFRKQDFVDSFDPFGPSGPGN